MRILCTEPTRIEVGDGKFAELDAHHEYYLDDAVAANLVARGRAVELDAHGRRVEAKPKPPAKKTAAAKPAAKKASSPASKPGGGRATKAVEAAPENKAAKPGPADEAKD